MNSETNTVNSDISNQVNQVNQANQINQINQINSNQTPIITIENALNVISQSLNKACKMGAFTLDEAYLIKIHLSVLQQQSK